MSDAVNHPEHYNRHPAGIECIDVVEHWGFNLGNAGKYLWRAGLKSDDAVQDLRKAAWYIEREIIRLGAVPDGVELTPLGAAKLPPGLTLAEDASLLNWLGENYVRQSDVQATQDGMIAEWERTQTGWDEAKTEIDQVRTSYEDACATIARMHAAAVGEARGPIRGVVEDVEDLRTSWLQAQSRLRAVLQEKETLGAERDKWRAEAKEAGQVLSEVVQERDRLHSVIDVQKQTFLRLREGLADRGLDGGQADIVHEVLSVIDLRDDQIRTLTTERDRWRKADYQRSFEQRRTADIEFRAQVQRAYEIAHSYADNSIENQQIAGALHRALAGLPVPFETVPDDEAVSRCPIPVNPEGLAVLIDVADGGWHATSTDHIGFPLISPGLPVSVGCPEYRGGRGCTRHVDDKAGNMWHVAGCDCRRGGRQLPLHAIAVWLATEADGGLAT